MKKRLLPLLVLVLLGALLRPVCAWAAPLDPNAKTSLTLHYQKEGKVFADLPVQIYRVAQAFPDGTFDLIAPYDTYPVNIHGITMQEQWQDVAETLVGYVAADGIVATAAGKTDETGTVTFADLQTGLYLVREVIADDETGTYLFNQFMVYLPTPQSDGSFMYEVEANPKCVMFIPRNQYTVTKLWQDAGHQDQRPKEVKVEIYRDSVLQETVFLNADNNWSYTWQVDAEDTEKWTVVERTVKDPYEVTIRKNGAAFSIVNTWQDPTDIPPTGDTFALLPMLLIAGLSGVMLLLLGLRSRRAA